MCCCFFGVSSGLRAAGRVDSSPVRAPLHCPSDTARSVKVNPLTILSDRQRWLGKSPLTVLQTSWVGTKSPPVHQLAFQLFTLCASLGSSSPLLSPLLSWRTQVSSSSHSTFHFSLPLSPPLLCQSGCVVCMIAERFKWRGLISSVAPYFVRPGQLVWCFSFTHCFIKKDRARPSRQPQTEATQSNGTVFASVPCRKRLLSV